jgi:hypothetical protein
MYCQGLHSQHSIFYVTFGWDQEPVVFNCTMQERLTVDNNYSQLSSFINQKENEEL